MAGSYDPLDERYGVAGRAGRWAATQALRGVLIAVLGAAVLTSRAVEPLRGSALRQRVRRAHWHGITE